MLIKPMAFWQQPIVVGVTPAAAQNIYICGYNFYKWKGTQLGSASSGGFGKLDLTGSLDTTFATNANPAGTDQVRFFAPLNGNFYADYRTGGGTTRTFKKLNATGSIVASVGTGTAGTIWGINSFEGNNFVTITGDTNISFNGTTIDGVGKINEDLTVNTTFATNIGTGPTSFVYGAVPTADRIAVCSASTNWNGNSQYAQFVVLNHDGTRYTGFTRTAAFGAGIVYTAVFVANRWIVVGSFTAYNSVTNNRILAFNENGSVDTTFTTNIGTGFNGTATSIRKISDTQVVVTGDFTTLNGATVNRIALLNVDGTIPAQPFGTGFSANPYGIQIGTNGKYYASGASFSSYNTTSATNNFISLNSDGSVNTAFATGSAMQTSTSQIAELGNLYIR